MCKFLIEFFGGYTYEEYSSLSDKYDIERKRRRKLEDLAIGELFDFKAMREVITQQEEQIEELERQLEVARRNDIGYGIVKGPDGKFQKNKEKINEIN